MMIKKEIKFKIFLIVGLLLLTSSYIFSQEGIKIKKTSKSESKVLFIEITDNLNGHHRKRIEEDFEGVNGEKIRYNQISGREGSFLGKYMKNGQKYWLYKLDDDLYIRSKIDDFWEKDAEYNVHNEYCFVFLSDFENIKIDYRDISIWLNVVKEGKFKESSVFSPESDDWFERFDKAKVIDVIPYYQGGEGNIWLLVETESGGKCRLRYDKTHITGKKYGYDDYTYYLDNPLNPDWGQEIIHLINEKKVSIGMTEYQVLVSWGKPDDINKTIGSYLITEQWVYNRYYSSQYLYFENGFLVNIQD